MALSLAETCRFRAWSTITTLSSQTTSRKTLSNWIYRTFLATIIKARLAVASLSNKVSLISRTKMFVLLIHLCCLENKCGQQDWMPVVAQNGDSIGLSIETYGFSSLEWPTPAHWGFGTILASLFMGVTAHLKSSFTVTQPFATQNSQWLYP